MEKLIPIYRKTDKNNAGYTLLLNMKSRQVYKVEYEEVNQYKYWIYWALGLAFLRGISELSFPMNHPFMILLLVILIGVSGFIGVRKYQDLHKKKREVFYTEDMIEDYIEKGKGLYKREVMTTVIIAIVFIILISLFLLFQSLILLAFGLFTFGILVYCLCGLPLERVRLYKEK